MSRHYPDEINRSGAETGCASKLGMATHGSGIAFVRCAITMASRLTIPANRSLRRCLPRNKQRNSWVVSLRTVRGLLRTKVLHGSQIVKFAPWQISPEALTYSSVVERVRRIREGARGRIVPTSNVDVPRLPGL